MSKTKVLTMMAVACWFVPGAVSLRAQIAADGAGVTVNLNGAQLMHRTPLTYPAEALAKGVEARL